jgi:hypothetical protein
MDKIFANKPIQSWAIFILIMVFAIVSIINDNSKEKQLSRKANRGYVNGYIYHTRLSTQKGQNDIIIAECRFTIGGKRYEQNYPLSKFIQQYSLLELKEFPVMYSSQNPDNNQLLIFPEDFYQYHISFPDSLNWVNNLR